MCFGNILEWYEFGIYVYFSPIISELFFDSATPLGNVVSFFLVFAIGFLSRPIGGLLFGYIGDLYGRRTALLSSIMFITLPTFCIGFLPTYHQIGWLAPVLLCLMRLLQGLPAGGEFPGTICYLIENASPRTRGFMGSWAFLGSQIGTCLNITECLLLEWFLPREDLVSWGWRASFIIGGLIGLCGIFLRYRLEETPFFKVLEEKNEVVKKPIISTFKNYKVSMVLGFFMGCLPLMGYWMIFVLSPPYFTEILGIGLTENLLINLFLIILSTASLPFMGRLGDRYDKKPMLIWSAIGVILLAYPFYYSASRASLELMLLFETLIVLLLTFHFAMIPALLSDLFPTPIRYTGVAMSYNFCNSILGGASPFLSLYLVKHTGIAVMPAFVFIAIALLSLATYFLVKERHGHLNRL